MDLVRVFMQERQLEFFKEAVDSEQKLRDVFRQMALNNWRPDRHSMALQRPSNGKLTNKFGGNVKALEMKKTFVEVKTIIRDEEEARNILHATVSFWREFSNSVLHHHAGDVVLNIPINQVLQWLSALTVMPDVQDLVDHIALYQIVCPLIDIEPVINVGIPTIKRVNRNDLNEYKDEDSQFIMQNKLGLLRRKRDPQNPTQILGVFGAKSQTTPRSKHQFIDGVIDETSPLLDWLVTKDTIDNVPMPNSRGATAPLLLLIYFLHPRYLGRGNGYYPIDAPEAGKVPLVSIVGCFPDLKTRYVANNTIKQGKCVYSEQRNDDDERPTKRAKIEPLSDDENYFDSDEI